MKMDNHKVGDWMAIQQDGKVFTGKITGIEHTRAGTKYVIDVLADDKYRSTVIKRPVRGDGD